MLTHGGSESHFCVKSSVTMQTLGLSPSTPKPTSRIRDLFWPKLEDEVAAVTAARNAMYAAFFVGITTAALGMLSAPNALYCMDVVLYFLVGIGVRQLSRTAALVGFFLSTLARLLSRVGLGDGS